MCLGATAPALSAEKSADQKPLTAEARLPNDDLAAAMQERGKVSEKDIAVLMPLAGTWDFTESFWTPPKGEPEHAIGTVTNDFTLDRHYFSSKASGSLNIGRQSMPFEAQEFIGFDTAKKAFSFIAIDTLTTGMTTGSGSYDEKSHVIKETGRFTNPLTGLEQDFRSEITVVDADHYTRSIFAAHKSGRETKLVEIDYTRRK
jgi:hypothetical protein